MQSPEHILSKEGILVSFSIAKKISEKDMKKIRNKINSSKTDSEKVKELLKLTIESQSDIKNSKIPGLILKESIDDKGKKRMTELMYCSSIISKKLIDNKIDKYHLCYVINTMINMLHLTEEDFEEFRKKFSDFKNEDDTDGENSKF